jgi:hypothetical protein
VLAADSTSPQRKMIVGASQPIPTDSFIKKNNIFNQKQLLIGHQKLFLL